jgi:AAA domain
LAVHLSIGTDFDSWAVPKAVPVLYIDGEIPEDLTRDRLKGLASANKNLTVLYHEELFNSAGLTMNLADPVAQKVITELCVEKGFKVLILDNLSCLVSGVKGNGADAWEVLLPWLLELRRRRIALVIVHHAGASGKRMRGTTNGRIPPLG